MLCMRNIYIIFIIGSLLHELVTAWISNKCNVELVKGGSSILLHFWLSTAVLIIKF